MSRLFLASILAVVLLASAAWSVTADTPWPMFRHDEQHSGRTNFTGPASPDTLWTFQANDGITASPTLGPDGTIYFGAGGYYQGGGDSAFYALNSDGSLKWLFKTDSGDTPGQSAGIFSSAAVGPDGAIYFGSLDAHMYCVEDSGTYAKMRWKNNPGDWPFYSSPVISDEGTVYAGCLNFQFYAFNPDGTLYWSYPTAWCVFSSPIFGAGDVIHVGSKDHNLWTFRDSTTYAEVIWTHPIGSFYDGHLIDCSPALGDNGTIYFGSDQYGAVGQTPVPVDTSFWAVNPDGTRKWAYYIGDGVESSPGIGHDGTIYFGAYDGKLYALEDSVTYGKLKWTFQTGATVDASPTIDGDGTIYVGSRDSTLYALNPDGTVKWTFKTGNGIESSVTVDDLGNIYFGSFDGKMYALGTGAPDAGVKTMAVPVQTFVETDMVPAARISNFRGYPLSFSVACVINDGSSDIYNDTVSIVDMDGGQADDISFAPFPVPPDTGVDYTVTVTTLLAGDDNNGNDQGSAVMHAVAEPVFVCGDVNGDGVGPDISDLVFLVSYMFQNGPPPPFLEATDVNGDGASPDIGDLVYLVTYMFQNGPPPDCP